MRSIWAIVVCILSVAAIARADPPTTRPQPDLGKPTLYVVGYAHLDTQWRWTYPQTIHEFIRHTMIDNFPLLEKYPDYVFNFTGSRRYMFMKEYFPSDFARVRDWVKAGRWFPCGSCVDECDANSPSAESLVRQVLYGNEFFRNELGRPSDDFMLPDSFGFEAGLPTILAHCGLRGFSTQKLGWGSAVGIPFKVGTWEGPDGRRIIAALDPGAYNGPINGDLSHSDIFLKRIEQTGEASGLYVDYHYYGTGDQGGAPKESSLKSLETSIKGDGPIHVIASSSYQIFDDITDQQARRLPTYKGDLLLTNHSAGSITSQAFMKRCNRENELLADAAERASVAAQWLGAAPYPSDRLYNAWILVLGSQMHDMMAGTAMPAAYDFIWNDELLALNQFAAITQDASAAVIGGMDTQSKGAAVVVYNPLCFRRQDVATANLAWPSADALPADVRVVGPDGKTVPSQVQRAGNLLTVQFLADVPAVGFACYDVQPLAAAEPQSSNLKVSENSLENSRFRVTLDANGDIASIFDKTNNREVLAAPARLAFLHEKPNQYPAWNMDWADRQKPPRAYVEGPATIRIVESGPCRVALEVTREAQGSRFVQQIQLADGDAANSVQVVSTIDWQTPESSLKASFPLAVSNPMATYDGQVGVVQRGNNDERKFEVPQHQWFDLTDTSGDFGVAVLNNGKYGSDKPDDRTMRLTLLYTPGVRDNYQDQATQDFGRHRIIYALCPHAGDWRAGDVPRQAERLNQPLLTFTSPSHGGPLGRTFSLVSIDSPRVALTAIKKAQSGDDIVIRLRELDGQAEQAVHVTAAVPILQAREVNGQEQTIGPATLDNGRLVVDLGPFAYRAFAVKLAEAPMKLPAPHSRPIDLDFDISAASTIGALAHGAFDQQGETYPAEEFPQHLTMDSVDFRLGPAVGKNALVCSGQRINLPADMRCDHVHILAAAVDGDQPARFKLDERVIDCTVQQWNSPIGQWDKRIWKGPRPQIDFQSSNPCVGLEPAFIKPAEVAWYSNHRHNSTADNEYYQYCYLFHYTLDAPPGGASTLTLPNNPRVRIFAVTASAGSHDATASAWPMYDTVPRSDALAAPTVSPPGGKFDEAVTVRLGHPLFWNAAHLRFTTDGSHPTASSPVYDGPIDLDQPATIKACYIDEAGQSGPLALARFDVNDVTPPRLTEAVAGQGVPCVCLGFSKPLRPDSVADLAHFHFDPQLAVRSAKLGADGRTVQLTLDQAPTVAAISLTISDVRDRSPAGNQITPDATRIQTLVPVYVQPNGLVGQQQIKQAGLPTKAADAWTLNLFCRPEHKIPPRTLLAGFGRADDIQIGAGRYLSNFDTGLHFWSRGQDVGTTTPIQAGRWQMLSATWDGHILRLFKDGWQVGQGQITLSDDGDSTIRLAPSDPWTYKNIFVGEIHQLTIWNAALPPAMMAAIYDAKKDHP
jgi:alpha-mannosidase